MSFLAPLYILGALAIAAPIVFHLIRRTPRGDVPFSSLMFLAPTPPRLTRRSRLDNLLLLLLRAAALILLAIAFARPFLREAARLDSADVERRRVAVLIDTSASLRRGDLWDRARAMAIEAINAIRPGDQLAVFAFDATTRPVMTFDESATLEPSRGHAVALARLAALEPTWASTDLGQALVDAVAAVEDVADRSEEAGRMPRRVVLIGDLAQGSRLDALGRFEWPSDVELELKTVAAPGGNAGLQWLAEAEAGSPSTGPAPAEADRSLRVRISNDPASLREALALQWVDARGAGIGPTVPAYVPPGESRVVRIPRPADDGSGRALRLSGDAYGFDNTIYLAAGRRDESDVLFVGPDAADDPTGLLYYLHRVFEDSPRRSVKVDAARPGGPIALGPEKPPALVVVAGEVPADLVPKLKAYAMAGGNVLLVLTAPGRAGTLSALMDAPAGEPSESPEGRDAMLGEIAFDHPLFAPLAGPQFNDFTKIRFWKHRRVDSALLAGARVVARFEGGDPAVIEKGLGKGRVVVLASGWAPADSQLARSSKFVPLMASLLEGRDAPPIDPAGLLILDRLPLPAAEPGRPIVVRKPDGGADPVPPGLAYFAGTDRPGVYTIEGPQPARSTAVNLDPMESRTSPIGAETLEQLGCRLAKPAREAADRDHLRQLQNAELEGRQKLWRDLILAAIGILIVETWLAGRAHRPRAEALAT